MSLLLLRLLCTSFAQRKKSILDIDVWVEQWFIKVGKFSSTKENNAKLFSKEVTPIILASIRYTYFMNAHSPQCLVLLDFCVYKNRIEKSDTFKT